MSSPRIAIDDLAMIDALERERSLTRAAHRLHVTQPAVSRRLRELEQRLSVRLCHRDGRSVELTPEGLRLLESARRILDEVRRTEDDLAYLGSGGHGTLRVCTECYMCYHWLPSVLSAFSARHPGVKVQIVPEATRQPLAALRDGRLDVAVVYYVDRAEDLRLVSLFEDELVAVVAAAHPLARRRHLTAADFEGQTVLCHYSEPEEPDRSILEKEVLRPAGVTPARVLDVQLTGAVLELVKAGMGISVLPRWALAAQPRCYQRLRTVRVTERGLYRRWYAATLARRAPRPFTTAFLDLLKSSVKDLSARRSL